MRWLLLVLLLSSPSYAVEVWKPLGNGLELAELRSPKASSHGDSVITVLRIDPKKARFVLLSAAQEKLAAMTARQWASKYRLRAVINAGMFDSNGLPVGYMQTSKGVVNPNLGSQQSVFAFGTSAAHLPTAQLIDRKCQDYSSLAPQYENLLQSLRIVDGHGRIVWARQPKQWSTAALGADKAGRILFIHSRSPYPVHDFAAILQQLSLDLKGLMYLEGGPEATLFVHSGKFEFERIGSYETGFFESDANDHAWGLPNVLGVLAADGDR